MAEFLLTAWPGYSTTALLIVAALSWLWSYRWQQRHRLGPKDWPLIGATIETLRHFDTMHDWILSYFQNGVKTFRVRMPNIVYTYTIDPNNVEYILKTNFANFPKVNLSTLWVSTSAVLTVLPMAAAAQCHCQG